MIRGSKFLAYLSFLLLFTLWLAGSCEDIIAVPDISDRKIELLAPADSLSTTQRSLNFSWASLDDATAYRFQLAQGGFGDQAVQMVVDSTLSGTLYATESLLSQGTYQWRVQGINDAYTTVYSTHTLFIDYIVPDISESVVTLLAPADGISTSQKQLGFSWEALEGADSYQFQLATPNFNSGETLQILEDNLLTDTEFNSEELPAGSYAWRVKARNTSFETAYTTRSFVITNE